jgi:hypothetical protein
MGRKFWELKVMLAAVGLALALPSCSTSGPGAKPQITEINLVARPVPVSLGSRPTIDGVEVKIYAANSDHPKAQPIRQGNLDFLLFDGLGSSGVSETNQPFRAWSFPPAELAARVFTSAAGTGYFFTLSWGKDRPQSSTVAVVARYRPPQGPPVYSSACFIELPPPAPVTPGPSTPAAPGAAPAVTNPPAPPAPGK